jgi:hypothetical protein
MLGVKLINQLRALTREISLSPTGGLSALQITVSGVEGTTPTWKGCVSRCFQEELLPEHSIRIARSGNATLTTNHE